MFAIPSISSYYFTVGKKYELYDLNERKTLGHVTCDRGYPRAILLDSKKSAHLWYAGEFSGHGVRNEDDYRWKRAGHFTFQD